MFFSLWIWTANVTNPDTETSSILNMLKSHAFKQLQVFGLYQLATFNSAFNNLNFANQQYCIIVKIELVILI